MHRYGRPSVSLSVPFSPGLNRTRGVFLSNVNRAQGTCSTWLTRGQHATRPAYIFVRVLQRRTYFYKIKKSPKHETVRVLVVRNPAGDWSLFELVALSDLPCLSHVCCQQFNNHWSPPTPSHSPTSSLRIQVWVLLKINVHNADIRPYEHALTHI